MKVHLLIFLMTLSACSVQKRCERHLKKAEQFGCLKIKNDTIVKLDTIKGFRVDTVVHYHNEIDTLLIDSGGVKSITIIRWKDKIVSQTITKKDTIIKTEYINRNIETIKEVTKIPFWIWLIIGFVGVISLGLLFKK